MKKIAIVTLTKNPNYGNVLQNIALQKILEKKNCVAETIVNYTRSTLFLKRTGIKRIINILLNRHGARTQELRRKRFLKCCNQVITYSDITYCNCSFSDEIAEKYDLFIAGSDQIWNPYFGCASEFELLSFAPDEKKISYAASFGISDFDKLPKEKQEFIISQLNTFKAVSCRESSGTHFINHNTNVRARTHIDPTMLIDASDWRTLEKKPDCKLPKRYIFVYMLGKIDDKYKKIINEKAKELNASVFNILDKRFLTLDPLEFLWLIDNSLFVCTDSFHACVFSILFHKMFCIFDRIDSHENQNSRFHTLLEKTGISPKTVVASEFGNNHPGIIDWNEVEGKLNIERNLSHEYLDFYIST